MAWVVYASDSKTSGAYADLPTARKRAQEEANRTGGSAIVYPTSRTGKAKGKTHHVKPMRKNPGDRTVKKIGKWTIAWVNGHLRVDNGWTSEYPIWHDHTQVAAYDFPERIPKAVKAAVIQEFKKQKTNPQIPNGRMVPARIRHKGKTYPGKVKRVNGRVKIFVTPGVARKINPQHTGLKIVPVTKERFSRAIKPLLRAPYNLMPFALYKRTIGKGMYMLYRGSEFIKAGTKTQLKRYAA